MTTAVKLNANELDEKFLDKVKKLFKNKRIEIRVIEEDETGYLLSTPANRDRLLKTISKIEKGKNLIKVDVNSL